jgi:hypothetical protein
VEALVCSLVLGSARGALTRGGTVPEAHIEQTPEGRMPVRGDWFILNLGEMAC